MPVQLQQEIINLKALERSFKKDVRKIQRLLNKEAEGVGRDLDQQIRALVRADLLSHGYSSNGIDEILGGIRVYQYKGTRNNVYSRIKVTLLGGGWANAHLGRHTDRTKKILQAQARDA